MIDSPTIKVKEVKPAWIAQKCPNCLGYKTVSWGRRQCPTCDGAGFIKVPVQDDEGRNYGQKN